MASTWCRVAAAYLQAQLRHEEAQHQAAVDAAEAELVTSEAFRRAMGVSGGMAAVGLPCSHLG